MRVHDFQPGPERCARRWLGRVTLGFVLGGGLFALVFVLAVRLQNMAGNAAGLVERDPNGLFQVTNVLQVHLRFSAEQWAAMEPVGGVGPFGGRGGPGGGGGGAPSFGPAMVLAPLFLTQADADKDGRLSREEFAGLGRKWFAAWDTNQAGRLDLDKLRAGLNASAASAMGAGPGGMPAGGGPPLQGAEGKRNGLASALGVEFPSVRGELQVGHERVPGVSVRYKGNGTFLQSRASLKRSLKVDLNDGFPGRRFAGVTKLNLHNCVTDAGWMNEVLSHRLFRDAGVPAPRTAYARVHVTVPGKYEDQYVGLYSVVENVDNTFARDHFGTKKGAIFKPVTRQLFEDVGDTWSNYQQAYDPKTPVSGEETGRVIAFAKLVSHASDAEFAAKVGEYVDLEEFSRFMAVTVWLSTLDSILGVGQNFLVFLDPKQHKFQFIPWDLDHSFGQFTLVGSQEQRDNLSIHKPWQGDLKFLRRMFQVEEFKRLYLARLAEFNNTLFRPERLQRQVDELAAVLRPAVADESAEKLAAFDKVVAGEATGPAGGAEPGPRFGGFFQPPKPIKTFVAARAKSVAAQLAGKAEGAEIGRLAVGGPAGPGGAGGGPGTFGPGTFLGPAFLSALDADKDQGVTEQELLRGFAGWFQAWNADQSGLLSEDQLRAGIDKVFAPPGNGPGGGFGFGGPGSAAGSPR